MVAYVKRLQIGDQEKALTDYTLEAAQHYVSKEYMNESERRILDSIRDLARRIDNVLHINRGQPRRLVYHRKPSAIREADGQIGVRWSGCGHRGSTRGRLSRDRQAARDIEKARSRLLVPGWTGQATIGPGSLRGDELGPARLCDRLEASQPETPLSSRNCRLERGCNGARW
jgi:hypothetical protein